MTGESLGTECGEVLGESTLKLSDTSTMYVHTSHQQTIRQLARLHSLRDDAVSHRSWLASHATVTMVILLTYRSDEQCKEDRPEHEPPVPMVYRYVIQGDAQEKEDYHLTDIAGGGEERSRCR